MDTERWAGLLGCGFRGPVAGDPAAAVVLGFGGTGLRSDSRQHRLIGSVMAALTARVALARARRILQPRLRRADRHPRIAGFGAPPADQPSVAARTLGPVPTSAGTV